MKKNRKNKILKNKARETFKDYDMKTKVFKNKKGYTRKSKHKKDYRDVI